jgi:hypothetical protein
LTTVRKILKKFDKSFKSFMNPQATVYLSKALSQEGKQHSLVALISNSEISEAFQLLRETRDELYSIYSKSLLQDI